MLNVSITIAIVFESKKHRVIAQTSLNIKIDDTPITFNDEIQNLGVEIDHILRFKSFTN